MPFYGRPFTTPEEFDVTEASQAQTLEFEPSDKIEYTYIENHSFNPHSSVFAVLGDGRGDEYVAKGIVVKRVLNKHGYFFIKSV